jgi:hypothetical protein
MKKISTLALAIGAGICINSAALADEIQFTTLPQTVQTTLSAKPTLPIQHMSRGWYATTAGSMR